MNVLNLLWLFFLLAALMPLVQQRALERARLQVLRSLERKRGSRAITLIHRQESIGLLGIPLFRYIDINDSEEILRAIRLTPDDMPIDLILHTPGGLVLATEQIAHAIQNHPARVTVFVPHYAMSGGTLLALAADEIVMDPNAVLGPVDPQLGEYPASSLLFVLEKKGVDQIDDRTLILADVARKAISQMQSFVYELLRDNMEEEKARTLARIFTEGRWTHDYPITYRDIKGLGLNVSTDVPQEIYQLMSLYPQAGSRRPSVQYIPFPYRKQDREIPR